MTDNTGYRITSPDGWVIEASNETQHRRVLVALTCLSEVISLINKGAPALQALAEVESRVPRDGTFDTEVGREQPLPPNPAAGQHPVDAQTLKRLWDSLIRGNSGGPLPRDPEASS
jgi:hypothetical protein